MTATANHALQRTAPCVTAPASAAAFPPTMQVPRRTPRSLSLGSLGVSPRLVFNGSLSHVCPEREPLAGLHGSFRAASSRLARAECSAFLSAMSSSSARLSSPVIRMLAADATSFRVGFATVPTQNETPNHALQRTGAAVTLAAISTLHASTSRGAGSCSTSLVRATPQPARQPRPSLSLGSLGVTAPLFSNGAFPKSVPSSMTYPESHRFHFRSERQFPARSGALSVRCS